ncbi:phage tail assembly chaperone [Burkholderia gladioli]|uniref:phage tail assembly chaperone n=1 Tax=Burkholderia gladioli TaxID=28095 RepID=UPI00068C9918|nr:putative phage tail assembly chaperone [Burkholderia gladioli]
MDKQHDIELDGVRYVMTPADAAGAWSALKNAGVLLQGMQAGGLGSAEDVDPTAIAAACVSTILSNLGRPEVAQLEAVVWASTAASVNGGPRYRVRDKFNEHFNQYRRHLIPVLMAGIRYQYADFFGASAFSSFITSVMGRLRVGKATESTGSSGDPLPEASVA